MRYFYTPGIKDRKRSTDTKIRTDQECRISEVTLDCSGDSIGNALEKLGGLPYSIRKRSQGIPVLAVVTGSGAISSVLGHSSIVEEEPLCS